MVSNLLGREKEVHNGELDYVWVTNNLKSWLVTTNALAGITGTDMDPGKYWETAV